jgi:hypothetical protein
MQKKIKYVDCLLAQISMIYTKLYLLPAVQCNAARCICGPQKNDSVEIRKPRVRNFFLLQLCGSREIHEFRFGLLGLIFMKGHFRICNFAEFRH